MKIKEFVGLANEILENEIPAVLLKDLNQGISVLEEGKEEGDYYIMGEYVKNELGNLIVLYFGSFEAMLEDESIDTWEEEIRSTIMHELTHHIESLAGEEKLAYMEELEELEEFDEEGLEDWEKDM